MRKRSQARVACLKYLYYREVNRERGVACVSLDEFMRHFGISHDVYDFAHMLVDGVLANRKDIDVIICKYAQNWKFNRITLVDRNILRMGIFELLHCGDIPDAVSINEAVDVAKLYGTEDSGKFVNGILDNVRIGLEST